MTVAGLTASWLTRAHMAKVPAVVMSVPMLVREVPRVWCDSHFSTVKVCFTALFSNHKSEQISLIINQSSALIYYDMK